MKILIISWYFPPFNAIGAVRVGKFARFMHERGHEVRVICGAPPGIAETLPLEIPRESVFRTRWVDVATPPRALQKLRKTIMARLFHSHPHANRVANRVVKDEPGRERHGWDRWLHQISTLYMHVLATPDPMVGWAPFAVHAGKRLGRQWKPNLIFASGPPFSTFVVASCLAKALDVPWVGEFRDRWVDDPYFNNWPAWRMKVLSSLEGRLMAGAAGVVTVSPPWAQFFTEKFGKPVATVFNGFDPRDSDIEVDSGGPLSTTQLTIVYTGVIYPGKRDPSPLFDAVARLGESRVRIKLLFVGTDPAHVLPLAARYGITDTVEIRPAVPYKDSLRIQRRADALLLLQWNDAAEQGNCPAKLFEYMAVLRPIIGIGLENGVPATIIRERNAGIFSNDPELLARQLEEWLIVKAETGMLPSYPVSTRQGLDRDTQFEGLEAYLTTTVLSVPPRAKANPSAAGK